MALSVLIRRQVVDSSSDVQKAKQAQLLQPHCALRHPHLQVRRNQSHQSRAPYLMLLSVHPQSIAMMCMLGEVVRYRQRVRDTNMNAKSIIVTRTMSNADLHDITRVATSIVLQGTKTITTIVAHDTMKIITVLVHPVTIQTMSEATGANQEATTNKAKVVGVNIRLSTSVIDPLARIENESTITN